MVLCQEKVQVKHELFITILILKQLTSVLNSKNIPCMSKRMKGMCTFQ